MAGSLVPVGSGASLSRSGQGVVVSSQRSLKQHAGWAIGVPDIVRFLPPSRSSSCFLSPEVAEGAGGSPRDKSLSLGAADIRERRLPPWLDSSELPLAPPEGPPDACGGWSRFQSPPRSRPSLRELSPPVIARGADGVEGGNTFAEAGPSGMRLSPSCQRHARFVQRTPANQSARLTFVSIESPFPSASPPSRSLLRRSESRPPRSWPSFSEERRLRSSW